MKLLKEITKGKYKVKAYIDDETFITPYNFYSYIKVISDDDYKYTVKCNKKMITNIINSNSYEYRFILFNNGYHVVDKYNIKNLSDEDILSFIYMNKKENSNKDIMDFSKLLIEHYKDNLHNVLICVEERSKDTIKEYCVEKVSIKFIDYSIVNEIINNLGIAFELHELKEIKDMIEDVVEHICNHVKNSTVINS